MSKARLSNRVWWVCWCLYMILMLAHVILSLSPPLPPRM